MNDGLIALNITENAVGGVVVVDVGEKRHAEDGRIRKPARRCLLTSEERV